MKLREEDEELFEDSPSEYIQMDIEGSDTDTRRRTACELVAVLGWRCTHHLGCRSRGCARTTSSL